MTLPMTLPIMLMIALAIRLTSPGPALLRLNCVGRNGVPFQQYRFRMIRSDSARRGLGQGIADPRQQLTVIGALLLPTGLNRLPQLFNVLKGEMSLIGPAAVSVAAISRNGQPDHRLFAARPGIVSPDHFMPAGHALNEHDRMALSLAYAASAGPATDGKLVLQSAARLLRRRDA